MRKKLSGVVPGTTDKYPEMEGMVFLRLDHWWAWERYWDTQEMYEKNVYYVPYRLPHTEENQNSKTNLATMDFGVVASKCKYVREAYEVLKFFCWGREGWEYKLTHYDEIMANSIDSSGYPKSVSGMLCSPLDSCPLTKDDYVWELYEAMFPTSVKGDSEGEKMGIDRTCYFDAFFAYVRGTNWTCYGGQQIAGFDSWWTKEYFSAVNFGDYMGIEDAVFSGDKNPADYVDDLTESANRIHKEHLELY